MQDATFSTRKSNVNTENNIATLANVKSALFNEKKAELLPPKLTFNAF